MKQPIPAAAQTLQFADLVAVGERLYWVEMRPMEQGRWAIVTWNAQEGARDLLPSFNVRSRVHEYGGGAFLVGKEDIYFIQQGDQQVHSLHKGQITALEGCRFADGCEHPDGSLFYVMEDHRKGVVNSLVRVNPFTHEVVEVAGGRDFFAAPRLSPDGRYLAYLAWDHPNMPWDGTDLVVQDLVTKQTRHVAGGSHVSVADPKWSPQGLLHYISDQTGWWNLYREGRLLASIQGELAAPQWKFGISYYCFVDETILCTYVQEGAHYFAKVHGDRLESFPLPYTLVRGMTPLGMIAASPTEPLSIVSFQQGVVKSSRAEKVTAPSPKRLNFGQAHGFYYPPLEKAGAPPLLVLAHGGPTGHVTPSLNMLILFWQDLGYAVLDVNYRGSTGYGRTYRESLKGQWGIFDVEDCVSGALYCVEQGLADRERLYMAGGSAGGFTVLNTLMQSSLFRAAAVYYAVSDLEGLMRETHKFESRYLDTLIGPYPAAKQLYFDRSPVHHVDRIKTPLIIFQGSEDRVVVPKQSETIYKGLLESGIPTKYFLFEGEAHGFCKGETIQKCLEEQAAFFLEHA